MPCPPTPSTAVHDPRIRLCKCGELDAYQLATEGAFAKSHASRIEDKTCAPRAPLQPPFIHINPSKVADTCNNVVETGLSGAADGAFCLQSFSSNFLYSPVPTTRTAGIPAACGLICGPCCPCAAPMIETSGLVNTTEGALSFPATIVLGDFIINGFGEIEWAEIVDPCGPGGPAPTMICGWNAYYAGYTVTTPTKVGAGDNCVLDVTITFHLEDPASCAFCGDVCNQASANLNFRANADTCPGPGHPNSDCGAMTDTAEVVMYAPGLCAPAVLSSGDVCVRCLV